MIKKAFQCRRGRFTVRGLVYRPEGENLPIAIVSHPFLQNLNWTKHYAKALAEMGYAAFCFDFVGGSVLNRSSGRLRDMTVMTEKADLKAVIDFARAQNYTDASRLTLMGCSQGGFVSALTAVDMQTEVEKLVLFYPALSIPSDARRGQMLDFIFDPQDIPPLIRAKGHLMHICREYATTVMDMDAYAAISPYNGPVLLVYGTCDEVIRQKYFRKAEEAYRAAGADIQVLQIPDAMHGFKGEEDVAAIKALRSFLLD